MQITPNPHGPADTELLHHNGRTVLLYHDKKAKKWMAVGMGSGNDYALTPPYETKEAAAEAFCAKCDGA